MLHGTACPSVHGTQCTWILNIATRTFTKQITASFRLTQNSVRCPSQCTKIRRTPSSLKYSVSCKCMHVRKKPVLPSYVLTTWWMNIWACKSKQTNRFHYIILTFSEMPYLAIVSLLSSSIKVLSSMYSWYLSKWERKGQSFKWLIKPAPLLVGATQHSPANLVSGKSGYLNLAVKNTWRLRNLTAISGWRPFRITYKTKVGPIQAVKQLERRALL